jgi:hypothetical protein
MGSSFLERELDRLEAAGHDHDLRYLGGWEGLVLEAVGRVLPGPDLEAAVVRVLGEEQAAGRLDRDGAACDWASVEERILVASVHLS